MSNTFNQFHHIKKAVVSCFSSFSLIAPASADVVHNNILNAELIGRVLVVNGSHFDESVLIEQKDKMVMVTTDEGRLLKRLPEKHMDKLFVKLGRGNDEVRVKVLQTDFIRVNDYSGDNTFFAAGASVRKKLHIDFGRGNDRVRIYNTTLDEKVEIELRAGTDYLSWDKSKILGSGRINGGDETYQTGRSAVEKNLQVNPGQTGFDRIRTGVDTNSMYPDLEIVGFETGVGKFGYTEKVDLQHLIEGNIPAFRAKLSL